ncbi:major facilitator superfamily domain-containing protein [Chaetomium fimeti]|jgi:MFS family permease|uniref:Major facilitator superfamily domain-containing protein n=1 Tax=Chaetomium fimeti TaxID=1854472 RepID=A0AAE0H604_9PEZI|nr:major facilitator superfamily domain-containing protein [Chaetomium fimeti]
MNDTPQARQHERVHDTEQTPLLGGTHNAQEPRTAEPDANDLSSARLAVVFGSIWIIVVLTALDSTIVATLTAVISTSFSSFNNLSWFGTAYLVGTAATQPLAGRWTDIYGRRRGLIVAGIVFGIGTLLCGLATREWVFILGRAVAGAGGGATTATSTFVGADLVPLRRRGVVQGINNIAMGCGTGLGGLVGGLFNKWFGWKMAFLVQLPIVVLGVVLCAVVPDIPSRPAKEDHGRRLDYAGSVTLVLAIVLLLVGLNAGGNQVAWSHPLVWSTMALAVILFALFLYIELRYAAQPIIPLGLLLHRTVWSGCLTYFFAHMAAFATMYYIPIYLQVRGSDPTHASLRFIPQSIGTAIGAYGTGLLIKATGNYVYLSAAAHVFLVAASALATTLDGQTPSWCPFLYLGMMGLGFGAMLVTTMLALISSVEHSEHAVVTSASFTFRAIGSSTGITVASAVFQNTLIRGLHRRLGDGEDIDELTERIRRNLDAIWELDPPTRTAVQDGYMESLRFVFIAILIISAISMACSLVMRQNKLHNNLARR